MLSELKFEVKSLGLMFGDVCVFRDVSFISESGSLTVIKGKNGAGKTCLLQCLCYVIPKHFDGVVIGGVELVLETHVRVDRIMPKHFGYLMQEPDKQLCFPFIEEELFFGAENVGRDVAEFNKDYELLTEMFPLLKWENIETNALSFGQKKVLLFSSLILKNPDVYLLDEPVAGLSDDYRERFMELIAMLRSRGKIVIVAEHSDYFDAVCDGVVFLHTDDTD
jgi:energy-coupling factor transporter ATP-binding protein EcfA2